MAELITFPAEFVAMYNQQTLAELVAEFQKLDEDLNNQEFEMRKLMIVNRLLAHLKGSADVLAAEDPKSSA